MYHLRFKGNHYEMGVKRGTIFNKCGITFPLHLDEFQIHVPELLDEVKGLAKVPFDDMFAWFSTMYGFGSIHGCTCFAFNDGDHTILCRTASSASVSYISDQS